MCFSIPYKILHITKGVATIENGTKIAIGNDIKAKAGEYLQVSGTIAVGVLTKKEGLRVRELIKKLNANSKSIAQT